MKTLPKATLFLLGTVLLCWAIEGAKGNVDDNANDSSGNDDDFEPQDTGNTNNSNQHNTSNSSGDKLHDDFQHNNLSSLDNNTSEDNTTNDFQVSDVPPTLVATGSPPTSPRAALSTPALIGLCATVGSFLIIVIIIIACKRRHIRSKQGPPIHSKNLSKPLEGDLLEANPAAAKANKKKQQEQNQQPQPQRKRIFFNRAAPKKLSSRRKKMNSNTLSAPEDEQPTSPSSTTSTLSLHGHSNALDASIYSNDEPTYSAAEASHTQPAVQQGDDEYGNALEEQEYSPPRSTNRLSPLSQRRAYGKVRKVPRHQDSGNYMQCAASPAEDDTYGNYE